MLIVISGFTCLCQCVFLIICNLSSFSVRNGGKYVLRCFPQQKTNLLDFNIKIGTQPSLSWFDQSLVISRLKYYVRSAELGCWERPADSRNVWNIFFYLFSVYVCLLSIIIIFAVRNLFNLFCFVLLCLDLCFILFCFFCFVLFRFCCCCFYVFFCFCV